MALRDSILPEFDHEMAVTRKTLERVPEDKPDWKPHDKSMTMSRLAGHVAELPGFVTMAFNRIPLTYARRRRTAASTARDELAQTTP